MTPLTANLKHYYQCRSMYINYAFLLIFLPSIFFGGEDREMGLMVLLYCMVWPAVVGLLVSTMVKDVAQKPFVFLLPRYEIAVARTTTVMSFVGVVLAGMLTLRSREAAMIPWSAVLGSGSAGLICYWAGVTVGHRCDWGLVLLIPILIAMIFPPAARVIVATVTSYAVVMACIAAAVSVAAHRIMAKLDLRRRYCMQLSIETVSGYVSPARAREYAAGQSGKLKDISFDWFCMGRILAAAPYSFKRQAWAAIYRWMRPTVAIVWGAAPFAAMVLLLVVAVILCGYLGDNGSVLFLIAGLLPMVGMQPGVRASLPCAIGRREKFYSLLAVSMVRTAMAGMIGLFCGLVSNAVPYGMPNAIDAAIKRILPHILVAGGFVPADMELVVLCAVVVPIVMLGMEIIARYRMITCLLVPTGGIVLVCAIVVAMFESTQPIILALKMTGVAWGVYIAVLFWGTSRWNLVGGRG